SCQVQSGNIVGCNLAASLDGADPRRPDKQFERQRLYRASIRHKVKRRVHVGTRVGACVYGRGVVAVSSAHAFTLDQLERLRRHPANGIRGETKRDIIYFHIDRLIGSYSTRVRLTSAVYLPRWIATVPATTLRIPTAALRPIRSTSFKNSLAPISDHTG